MGKNVVELDAENFDDFVKEDTVVVDFWAEWCGPCKMMGPIFEEVAEELEGRVKLGKVNVDNNSDLAQKFQVMSIPTLIFFKDGKPVDRITGVLQKEDLIRKIQTIK